MKSIKNKTQGTYQRLSDLEAEKKVRSNTGWEYCSKTEYRNKGAEEAPKGEEPEKKASKKEKKEKH